MGAGSGTKAQLRLGFALLMKTCGVSRFILLLFLMLLFCSANLNDTMCLYFLFRALWNIVVLPLAMFYLGQAAWNSVLEGHWRDVGVTVLCLVPLCRSRSIVMQAFALYLYRHFVRQ